MTIAEVRLWGRRIGAVVLDDGDRAATFQYDPPFVRSGIQVAPLMMPLSTAPYRFAGLNPATFHGLPGLLADSLPDRYGNAVIDVWLASQGRSPASFDAVERLCYVGDRGMGALEFVPAQGPSKTEASLLNVEQLVRLASDILSRRQATHGNFEVPDRAATLGAILAVGTSAGGARAKAVIAWNRETNEVRSGQIRNDPAFTQWLLKFDGVAANGDHGLADPQGFGSVEYAYSLMARAAGITMTECRLLEEGGRRHFMTRRFDRPDDGSKVHMQSLGAIAHLDFNDSGSHSYEHAFLAMRRLQLPVADIDQQFRRMVFNVVARNQDDHVKNIAFLMDKQGRWSLSPAFDVSYNYNPDGIWTNQHQMSINGRRDDITVADIKAVGRVASLLRSRPTAVLDEVQSAVLRWHDFAETARVPEPLAMEVARNLRTQFPPGT